VSATTIHIVQMFLLISTERARYDDTSVKGM